MENEQHPNPDLNHQVPGENRLTTRKEAFTLYGAYLAVIVFLALALAVVVGWELYGV